VRAPYIRVYQIFFSRYTNLWRSGVDLAVFHSGPRERLTFSREIPRMARETVYLVQSYTQGKRTRLIADAPVRCKSPDSALRTAERLAMTKAGVVAFSTSGDAELG